MTTVILHSQSSFRTQMLVYRGDPKGLGLREQGGHTAGRPPHQLAARTGPRLGSQAAGAVGSRLAGGVGGAPPRGLLAARLAFCWAPSLPVTGAEASSRRSVSVSQAMSGWLTTVPGQLPGSGRQGLRPSACHSRGRAMPAASPSLALLAEPVGKGVGASVSRSGPRPATECGWTHTGLPAVGRPLLPPTEVGAGG